MASLKNIKLKILSYKKTGTVTHAMEAVSAVKMRKGQERALGGRAYAVAALTILRRVSNTVDLKKHPLMSDPVYRGIDMTTGKSAAKLKVVFIVVTSDKGLAGTLNSGVIRATEREISRFGLSKDQIIIVALGRRGGDYFASKGYEVRKKYENVSDGISELEVLEVTRIVLSWHENKEIEAALIAYTNFISTFEQEPVVRQIVPITPPSVHEIVVGIRPAKGKYAPAGKEAYENEPVAYTIEPDADTVLDVLLPKLLNIAVFHALLESKASEHSARMVAMKSATDKAEEMAGKLTRTFNKVRQAAITREVSEITSGIEAMK